MVSWTPAPGAPLPSVAASISVSFEGSPALHILFKLGCPGLAFDIFLGPVFTLLIILPSLRFQISSIYRFVSPTNLELETPHLEPDAWNSSPTRHFPLRVSLGITNVTRPPPAPCSHPTPAPTCPLQVPTAPSRQLLRPQPPRYPSSSFPHTTGSVHEQILRALPSE